MERWSEKTELPLSQLVAWAGIGRGRFYDWKQRYGKANEHNGKVPRDHWIEPWERAFQNFCGVDPAGIRRAVVLRT